ncbi:hypothetical protein [Nesterenkonia haasae]|uniref:hypothetical protein n=1 Tax=Nesterenkonia haasae TaxID=2587813 RepID=UPI00139162F1|nr:hypothetical protein [Nesterenkonia haasae]NDK32440.1 hypothetical protein [Nesterenkonia haasae]
MAERILTENEVVDAVRAYLVQQGWEILSFAHGQNPGYDIHAAQGQRELMVEAKGAGSGTPGTQRYGKLFTQGQVITHVSRAVFVALERLNEGYESAIALPDNARHRAAIGRVSKPLAQLGISVYYVTDNSSIRLHSR